MPTHDDPFLSVAEEALSEGLCERSDPPLDYSEWAAEPFWTAEQAAALSFGLEPEDVNWDEIDRRSGTSHLARRMYRFYGRIKRTQAKGYLENNMPPHDYIAWALSKKIALPQQLTDAVTEVGGPVPTNSRIRDLESELRLAQAEVGALKQKLEAPISDLSDRDLDRPTPTLQKKIRISDLTNQKRILRKIALGVALEKYGYKADGKPNQAVSRIAIHLRKWGVSVSEDAIHTHLEEARLEFQKEVKEAIAKGVVQPKTD